MNNRVGLIFDDPADLVTVPVTVMLPKMTVESIARGYDVTVTRCGAE